ncbi:MAG TPA: hypothetical protein DGG94_16505 [Micromonosporaceae bacterium]|nr:hypothetical protein [Micromonosporaceae bacterium]HCU51372.1 hypothetical protein [Micromonosporaceae bacterium]
MNDKSSFIRVAGMLCLVGAVIGAIGGLVTAFYPAAVASTQFSYPFTPTGYIVAELSFALNHVLLLIGLLGVSRSGAAGTGLIGRSGLWIAVGGMAVLTICELRAMTLANSAYPAPETDLLDMGYGAATILIGIGLTMAGIAVARARIWTGWARFVLLACGVAVFVVVLPGVFGPFLAGRLVLVTWMLMFAALGLALVRSGQPSSMVSDHRAKLEPSAS